MTSPMQTREIEYRDALREAMSEEMRRDPRVYLMPMPKWIVMAKPKALRSMPLAARSGG